MVETTRCAQPVHRAAEQ